MNNLKKDIVIINQDSGYLMIDTANAFAQQAYNVTLITGRLVERNTPLKNEIKLEKIIKYNNSSAFLRLFTWFLAAIQIFFIVKLKYPKSELLIVSNPPLAPLLAVFLNNKYSILVYDIFPDVLVDSNIFKTNSWLIRSWEKMNKKVYSNAQKVFTITNGMKSILCQYVENENIKVIPIWADVEFLKPIAKLDNLFIKKHELQDKFIVLYSGNIAKTGDADIMIDLAIKSRYDADIIYLIIGEGVNKDLLQKQIEEFKLNNCIMLPWQKTKMLPYSLSSASLAVVSLGKSVSKIAMPSKLYSYLAVGSPILSISPSDSDLAKIVVSNNIGQNFDVKNTVDIYKFIINLKSDIALQNQFHSNSLKTAQLFTSKNAYEFIF
jgi:glycosyltransferase involved in cell wall biosynthesis